MICVLKVCSGELTMREITNPSPERIEQAIDELLPVKYHFAVLEPELPVKNCLYIQTLIVRDDTPEIKYTVEARFEYGEKIKHYQRFMTDTDALKKMFRMFALSIVPDTTGWNDITAEVMGEE